MLTRHTLINSRRTKARLVAHLGCEIVKQIDNGLHSEGTCMGRTQMQIYTGMNSYMYINIHMSMNAKVHTYAYMYIRIYLYIHVCMYLYARVYM